jgi:hypothetical protein
VAQHPLIGYLAWAVLFGALFAWEGLALARAGSLPTLSGTFRVIMGSPFGRWALFALWLWAGWHFSSAAGTSCSGPDPAARQLGDTACPAHR